MDSKLWPCTLAFFCVSILFGMAIQVVDTEWRRQLYVASVMTALGVTAGMLFAIAEAYMRVKASVTAGQTWSVGFVSIFEGTYVKDLPEQWLISMTGPPRDGNGTAPVTVHNKATKGESAAPSQAPDPGSVPLKVIQSLGAPMWVVFLAVIGAALSTVALIVKEIRSPPSFFAPDPAELRERMLILVQNQFFMLFAPLGSIFVYQGLVLGAAASQPFVVGVAALGAGATLNTLLSLAVSKASNALEPSSQKTKGSQSVDSSANVVERPVAGRAGGLNDAETEKYVTPHVPSPLSPVAAGVAMVEKKTGL
ncbi:MAG TPA: hypothetical protein VFE51_25050 [Verrucomicrobiae bacterium]|nr:hypothetical protein [Verrucomicrobiae bacterium]